MSGKTQKIVQRLQGIRIDDVAAEGKCLIRTEEGVIFVEGRTGGPVAAPGDVVDIRIVNRKKQYREAVVEKIHAFGPSRSEPFCPHFGTCGGCKWQHIRYEEQLRFKGQQVFDHLSRIGKVQLPPIHPTLPSQETRYYRNKLEFTCADGRWMTEAEIRSGLAMDKRVVGFHIPKRFDKILSIDHCYLQPDPSNAIRLAVDAYAREHGFSMYNLNTHLGFLRTVIIRTASTGQVMVTIQVAEERPDDLEGLLTMLQQTFPQIASLNYILNRKLNDSYQDQEVISYGGKPYIEEQMDDGSGQPLTFRVGPKSFYQTNARQAFELYKITRDWAGLTGTERVYDLYTGTGTIGLFVARQAREVIGIEYIEAAVEDARVNAAINGIQNATFLAGDMGTLLTPTLFRKYGKPDVVITDPPRAGMDEAVTRNLLLAAPQRIVYVSCNTATQARDLAILDSLYEVKDVQPVDMFPHTHHVENVVRLEKRMVS
ncbi:23S rRNA (uracil(1939)-C(5))-methyltransferase RlmD [Larkinella rosea]|uniref:23S rRNA (Uracil(1939)-C(5))-methyltransferase RlmD n=1 Tax=Larkinella rosea TaxID=2025312 RepID=A0A3P1C1E6_9BACT|nr:23S rRNA (uracil(1939)-C(5))-methyltransferase RlmD [Larkinella rosea]RRB06946.1 23S rRNA (uracil(1939)-C(5))-methyltransferase RlmD [Larkinella rosea]